MAGNLLQRLIKMSENPLVESVFADLIVFTGMDRLKAVLKGHKNPDTQQPSGITTATKLEPPKLQKVFINLDKDQRKELAAWLPTVSHHYRVQIERMEEADLKTFLGWPREERLELLATFEESPAQLLTRAKDRLKNIDPIMPKTAQVIRELGEWGNEPEPQESPWILAIRAYTQKLINDIRNCRSPRI